MDYKELLKNLFEISQPLNNMIVYIIAGSILLVISTDYLRPPSRTARLIYLLLLPAWTDPVSNSLDFYKVTGNIDQRLSGKFSKMKKILCIHGIGGKDVTINQWSNDLIQIQNVLNYKYDTLIRFLRILDIRVNQIRPYSANNDSLKVLSQLFNPARLI